MVRHMRRPQTEDRNKKETEMEMANRGDEMTWSFETYPKKEKITRSEEKDLRIPDLTYTTHIASMWTLRRMMMGVRFSLQMWICQIPMPMHRASGKEKESGYVWCVGDIVVVIVAVIVSLSVPPSSVGHEEKNLISLPPGPWGPGWYALRLTSHTIHIHLCPNTGWSSVSDTLQKVFWTGLHYYYYCRRRGIPTSVTAPICFYLWTWETYPWCLMDLPTLTMPLMTQCKDDFYISIGWYPQFTEIRHRDIYLWFKVVCDENLLPPLTATLRLCGCDRLLGPETGDHSPRSSPDPEIAAPWWAEKLLVFIQPSSFTTLHF